jgi:dephospho-CoA kinase
MKQGSQGFVLCGGIGAGKSYVAALFQAAGVDMVDADAVGHQVLAPEGACFRQVARRWPKVVVNGEIDRKALGSIVFQDSEQLQILESITHPEIASEIRRKIAASESRLVGIERPFLDGLVGADLPMVLVDAPTELRLERLISRGMEPEDVFARMAAQPSRQEWLVGADFVIDNDRGADLEEQVHRAIAWLESFVTGNG